MKAVIEIAADSRGVVAGLQPANKALDDTAKKADRAEKEVKQLGQSAHVAGRDMGAAFAATGGGLAVTHGLVGMTDGFRRADGAMAAFAASQALLDLGRFAEDMKSVNAATGGATSVFGTLGAVMKAHPLMTIATVLAGAASFMGIFASETDEAKDSVDELGKSIKELQAAGATRLFLTQGLETGASARMAAIEKGLQDMQMRGYQQVYDVQQLSRIMGLPAAEIMRVGQQIGAPGFRYGQAGLTTQMPRAAAQEIVRDIYQNLTEALRIERMGVGARFRESITGMPELVGISAPQGAFMPQLPPGFGQAGAGGMGGIAGLQLLPFALQHAAQFYQQGNIFGGFTGPMAMQPSPPVPGTGLMPFGMNYAMQQLQQFSPGAPGAAGTGLGLMMPGMNLMGTALVQSAEYMREQNELAKQRMQELIGLGEQFGQTIGDAFFRVAEGTMTARQAMAELVRMFAQMAAQGIFRQIGGAVGASFAPSQAQATANVTPPPTGMGP